MKRRLASLLATAGLLAGMTFVSVGIPAVSATTTAINQDSLGTDFWLAFPGNTSGSTPALTLFLSGPTAASGEVAAPGVAFSTTFTVTPGAVTSVALPNALDIQTSSTVGNLGIHVTADAEIAVYGLNQVQFSTDAYLGLPTDVLGTSYIAQGYNNAFAAGGTVANGTQFALVATQDGTTVTIIPTVTTDGHAAGTPYNVALDQGQTYQLRNNGSLADLSGSIVSSDKPIAAFGGHQCGSITGSCDHLVEEMTPTNTWGTTFVTEPLARTAPPDPFRWDTYRFLAGTDGTHVAIDGGAPVNLNRGQFFTQQLFNATTGSLITSDKPILVTQYMISGITFTDGDPFEVIVPPVDGYLTSYTVTTPATGFPLRNFINVVTPTSSVGSLLLDGVAVPAASFTAIPGSTFSGAQLPVAVGQHTLTNAGIPFGATAYGYAGFDSYGYPGGFGLSSVSPVNSVALAPRDATDTINTEHCATATVIALDLTPVAGVGVAFTVTGVNPTSGFGNTGPNGTAEFCYTGVNTGDDTIGASVGAVSDSTTQHWTDGSPVVTTVALAPPEATNPVNTEHCVTATVTDQHDLPVEGVGVDFTVTGVNATSGSGTTDALGTAEFCYTGTNPGDDSIKGAVDTVFGTAIKHWTPVDNGDTLSALGDAHGWIGLKNGDDNGAKFDLRVELLKNGITVASGLQRCIPGVVRNPNAAKEAVVPWDAFSPVPVASGDVLAIRLSARIGTRANDSACNGAHNSAVGLRFYYDATARGSRFAATIGSNPSVDLYLHSTGLMCNNTESPGVTARTLSSTASVGALPGKCKDSPSLRFARGNQWVAISTWSLAPLP